MRAGIRAVCASLVAGGAALSDASAWAYQECCWDQAEGPGCDHWRGPQPHRHHHLHPQCRGQRLSGESQPGLLRERGLFFQSAPSSLLYNNSFCFLFVQLCCAHSQLSQYMERYRWGSWGKAAQHRQGLGMTWLAPWLQGLACFSPVESYCIKSSADEKTLASLSKSDSWGWY